MAQNISLDKSSRSAFAKALKNIKKLMKENDTESEENVKGNVPTAKAVMGKNQKIKRPTKYLGRGVVYLSHIPKGFYEDEMMSYFNQFGLVTRLNVVRSKTTGNPKGYAFIEFLYSEVAQVVAETMNNYLMFGKVLKAEYIPGDQVRRGMFAFSKIHPDTCPRTKAQNNWIDKKNKILSNGEVTKMRAHDLKRLNKIKKQMQDSGIEFDCQVEDASVVILNNPSVIAVLELDATDTKVQEIDGSNLLEQKNRKRSLSASSASSTPGKKCKSLVKDLKSKKDSQTKSPKESLGKVDKTPVLKLMRLDQMSSRNVQKLNKSPLLPPNKEKSLPKETPQKEATPKMSSASKKSLRSKEVAETPAVKKQKSPDGSTEKRPLITVKKSKTPDTAKKGKKIPLLVGRKSPFTTPKSPGSTKKSKLAQLVGKQKAFAISRTPDSMKKSKKSPQIFGKWMVFSTSKKLHSSQITRR